MPESPSELDATATRLVGDALDEAMARVLAAPHGAPRERDQALVPAMNALCARLGTLLTRWVGAEGWRALLRRGLDEAVRTGGARGLSQDADGELHWKHDASRGDASLDAAHAGCVQVLVGVTRVLARFIGDGMALRLIEQGVARDDSESGQGSHHG